MEITPWVKQFDNIPRQKQSLNPCFNGNYSLSCLECSIYNNTEMS